MILRSLASHANREAALVLAESEFGGLDLAGRSVRDDLSGVAWDRSLGIVGADGRCRGFILAANLEMPGYPTARSALSGLPDGEMRGIMELRGIRGDALVIRPEAKALGLSMLRRFLSSTCSGYDYAWGTAHADLGNEGFWSRHAVVMAHGNDGEIVFAVPLNTRARAVLAGAAATLAGMREECVPAPGR